MSTSQLNPFSLPTALTASSEFCGVTVDANGDAVLPSAGGTIIGVMVGLSGTGSAASINGPGTGRQKLRYGGTVTKGDDLKIDAAGKFVTASGGDTVVAKAFVSGSAGDVGAGILIGSGGTAASAGSQAATLGTDTPSNLARVIWVSTDGTKTGALAAGLYNGQMLSIVQAAATNTPVGTITGTFADTANTAKTTLHLGTAAAFIGEFCWNGSAWRQVSALGGTGSSLS